MKVSRWMSSPAITVPPDVPASLALRKMLENEIRRLPVVDEEQGVLGIVSDRDLRTILPPFGLPRAHGPYTGTEEDPPVHQVMRHAVAVVTPEDDIRHAVSLMHDLRISGLPVVRGRECVGVITVTDLLEVLSAALDSAWNEVNVEIRERTSRRAPEDHAAP
jgi:acetoin utilization protein AcuB